MVMYSATKLHGGHSDLLAGVLVTPHKEEAISVCSLFLSWFYGGLASCSKNYFGQCSRFIGILVITS